MKKYATIVLAFVFLLCFIRAYADNQLVQMEADYILQCQFIDESNPAHGCINDIFGLPTWVVPRENAMAILGLIMAKGILGQDSYLARAQLAAGYLCKVQDADGAWYNQYSYITPGDPNNLNNKEAWAKSPTQTAEVMIALFKLGFKPERYLNMRNGARYLMDCQKFGGDGYLIGGGKDYDGVFRNWRWASDNSYAYQALRAAEFWAFMSKDYAFARLCTSAARKILSGINSILYIKDPSDPDYGVWYRVVDENNQPIDPWHHDWINYAPQMLDVPATGVNNVVVGEWIHSKLQKSDGACVWDDSMYINRKSPGYSFQATLCWLDLKQNNYYEPAQNWAMNSGLWQVHPDGNGVSGGWIDWIEEGGQTAQWWERFIDTSFYAIATYNGGFNFGTIAYSKAEPKSIEVP
jgi:hypothetical protein